MLEGMALKVTRRQIATVLVGTGVLAAQQAPPEDELKVAREQIRQNSELMAKIALPVAIEPAVHFKV